MSEEWRANRRLDLRNQKFGRLTVVSFCKQFIGSNQGSHWNCICECGGWKIVTAGCLKKALVKSCGCLHTRDLTSQVFGRLTVVRPAKEDERKFSGTTRKGLEWVCLCECGTSCNVLSSRLKNGMTKSCGCLKHESPLKGSISKRRMTIEGETFAFWTFIRDLPNAANKQRVVEARCVCGLIKAVKLVSLTNGTSKSCGCMKFALRSGENQHTKRQSS